MSKPIEIKVGGTGPYDPAAGATDCNIPALAGADGYLEKIGYGPYPYANYQVLTSGGFRLLDDTFVDGEMFYFHPTSLAYGIAGSSSYTNGFNLTQVLSACFGRVGWRQTTLDGEPVLNSTNLTARSGRRFNDGSFHSLVTLANIKAVMEDAGVSDAEFNAHLEVLQRSAIMRTLTSVFGAPEYKSQALAYDRYGNHTEKVTNSGKFVGIKITIPPAIDRAVQLDSVALYFDSAVTIPLYLYSDLKTAPLWTDSVTTVANSQAVVSLPDIVLNHIGPANHGGTYYLGYYQSDLGSAKAIRENDVRFNDGYLYGVQSVEANGTDWQHESLGYNSYGINPHISVFVDHTWQIVKKSSLFDNAFGLGMACMIVENVLFSRRINGDKRILAEGVEQAMGVQALEGVMPVSDAPQRIPGLRSRYDAEVKRIIESFNPKSKSFVGSLC